MSSSDRSPGSLVVIKDFVLVRRFNSEEEHYTERMQTGLVLTLAHIWHELGSDGDAEPTYLVMFSKDMRLYYVPSSGMMSPDQATCPSRLFGRLRG